MVAGVAGAPSRIRGSSNSLLPHPMESFFAPTDTWDKPSRSLPGWGMLNTALGETEPSPLKEAAKP